MYNKKSEIVFNRLVPCTNSDGYESKEYKKTKSRLMKTYAWKMPVLVIDIVYKNLNHSFLKDYILKKKIKCNLILTLKNVNNFF